MTAAPLVRAIGQGPPPASVPPEVARHWDRLPLMAREKWLRDERRRTLAAIRSAPAGTTPVSQEDPEEVSAAERAAGREAYNRSRRHGGKPMTGQEAEWHRAWKAEQRARLRGRAEQKPRAVKRLKVVRLILADLDADPAVIAGQMGITVAAVCAHVMRAIDGGDLPGHLGPRYMAARNAEDRAKHAAMSPGERAARREPRS